ncbi:MAG TPA: ABC transporter permease, partial [bacterium]|nr:ABC transporter permease [bacterium]
MLKNYLKIAVRNLVKYKGYNIINVSGLALGLTCCILIFLFIRHEWSYDNFHERKDLIYSLTIQERQSDGHLQYHRLIPLGVPEALGKEYTGIRSVVQFVSGDVTLMHAGQAFREEIFEADSTFFRIFSFPLLAGDPNTALSRPAQMVVSEMIAHKYFGEEVGEDYQNVLGNTLSIRMRDGMQDFRISGVMKNCPDNSSLQTNILIPFRNYPNLPLGSNEINGRTSTYVLLDESQDVVLLEQALQPFIALHFKDRIESRQARGLLAPEPDALQLRLQPLRELHLNPEVPVYYEQPPHDPRYSYLLSGIALIVLLIGCINFTSLSMARSTSRAREVGMRKAMGALKRQLMAQFWGEAILLAFLALMLG